MNDNSKTIAIVAHITFLGWIVAVVLNSQNKTEFGSFYIRQMLGIFLMSFAGFIPVIGWAMVIFSVVLWVLSLVNAIGDKIIPVPVVGELFQDWFRGM